VKRTKTVLHAPITMRGAFHAPYGYGRFRSTKNTIAAPATESQNHVRRGKSPGKGRRPEKIRNSETAQ
jgi:hypothetical protein